MGHGLNANLRQGGHGGGRFSRGEGAAPPEKPKIKGVGTLKTAYPRDPAATKLEAKVSHVQRQQPIVPLDPLHGATHPGTAASNASGDWQRHPRNAGSASSAGSEAAEGAIGDPQTYLDAFVNGEGATRPKVFAKPRLKSAPGDLSTEHIDYFRERGREGLGGDTCRKGILFTIRMASVPLS